MTTTPEKMARINPQNISLMESFLREKDIRSATGTVDGYRSDLNIFFVYVLDHLENKFFVDIRKLEFAEYFNFCVNELQWNSARFNRMRSCLSSMSNFIEKYLDDMYPSFRNAILKVIETMPLSAAREKTILSENQVNLLLQHLMDTNRKQEACLVAPAVASGARASELLRFRTDIIDLNNLVYSGVFIETTEMIKTKGRTKSGDLKYKYIIKSIFDKYYTAWMTEREEILRKTGQSHNYLFIRHDGVPATTSTIRNWIPEWETFLGVNVYAHAFRHYTVTFLTRMGLPSDLIVELMGWKSSEMYKIYNDLTSKDREWKELDAMKEYLKSEVVHDI